MRPDATALIDASIMIGEKGSDMILQVAAASTRSRWRRDGPRRLCRSLANVWIKLRSQRRTSRGDR
jgi:hypothetical protein